MERHFFNIGRTKARIGLNRKTKFRRRNEIGHVITKEKHQRPIEEIEFIFFSSMFNDKNVNKFVKSNVLAMYNNYNFIERVLFW